MFVVRNQSLSATMELSFQTPAPFEKDVLKGIANTSLGAFEKFGLRGSLILQRVGDALFDYDLSFSLFNGQATFRIGAEKAFVNVQNARGRKDLEIVAQCMASALDCFQVRPASRIAIHGNCHALFEQAEDCEAFFKTFADPAANIVDGGRISFVQETGWPSPVRVLVERSLSSKNAAFVTWSTEWPEANLENLRKIADCCGKATDKIGLHLEFE